MVTREIEVSPQRSGSRADLVIGEALGISRAKVKQLFEDGRVALGRRLIRKGDAVEAGQRIQVALDEPLAAVVPEHQAPLAVLYADESLVFLDKPSGVPSHPLVSGETGSVANSLVARFPECAQVSTDPREGGLCHRLDVETSGVLLAARTPEAWQAVRKQFQQRQVDKYYLGLVSGPLADDGEIEIPLRHDPKHRDRVEAAPEDAGARKAKTIFRVRARSGIYSLVEAQIITGVLHQVRAHLSAIGAPLVGDQLYGGANFPGLGRFFLHARTLALEHPIRGERLSVSSPLPGDLALALQAAGFPAGLIP